MCSAGCSSTVPGRVLIFCAAQVDSELRSLLTVRQAFESSQQSSKASLAWQPSTARQGNDFPPLVPRSSCPRSCLLGSERDGPAGGKGLTPKAHLRSCRGHTSGASNIKIFVQRGARIEFDGCVWGAPDTVLVCTSLALRVAAASTRCIGEPRRSEAPSTSLRPLPLTSAATRNTRTDDPTT